MADAIPMIDDYYKREALTLAYAEDETEMVASTYRQISQAMRADPYLIVDRLWIRVVDLPRLKVDRHALHTLRRTSDGLFFADIPLQVLPR